MAYAIYKKANNEIIKLSLYAIAYSDKTISKKITNQPSTLAVFEKKTDVTHIFKWLALDNNEYEIRELKALLF